MSTGTNPELSPPNILYSMFEQLGASTYRADPRFLHEQPVGDFLREVANNFNHDREFINSESQADILNHISQILLRERMANATRSAHHVPGIATSRAAPYSSSSYNASAGGFMNIPSGYGEPQTTNTAFYAPGISGVAVMNPSRGNAPSGFGPLTATNTAFYAPGLSGLSVQTSPQRISNIPSGIGPPQTTNTAFYAPGLSGTSVQTSPQRIPNVHGSVGLPHTANVSFYAPGLSGVSVQSNPHGNIPSGFGPPSAANAAFYAPGLSGEAVRSPSKETESGQNITQAGNHGQGTYEALATSGSSESQPPPTPSAPDDTEVEDTASSDVQTVPTSSANSQATSVPPATAPSASSQAQASVYMQQFYGFTDMSHPNNWPAEIQEQIKREQAMQRKRYQQWMIAQAAQRAAQETARRLAEEVAKDQSEALRGAAILNAALSSASNTTRPNSRPIMPRQDGAAAHPDEAPNANDEVVPDTPIRNNRPQSSQTQVLDSPGHPSEQVEQDSVAAENTTMDNTSAPQIDDTAAQTSKPNPVTKSKKPTEKSTKKPTKTTPSTNDNGTGEAPAPRGSQKATTKSGTKATPAATANPAPTGVRRSARILEKQQNAPAQDAPAAPKSSLGKRGRKEDDGGKATKRAKK